jgi:DNA-binding NtrC family response regulator
MPDATAGDTLEGAESGTDEASTPRAPHLFLCVECARPGAGGARHALSNVDEVVLGRGTARTSRRIATPSGVRQLELRVPDRRMSAVHARLRRAGGGWTLEDAGSKNGSIVNGERMAVAGLEDGDLIELGHTFFIFRSALRTPVRAPGDLDASDLLDRPTALATLDPAFASSLERLARIGRSEVPVLLLGETGTGKELLARAIHEASERSGSFVAINCGALPQSLLEAQLFGHSRGAFSGAVRDEPGYVRAAHGGTLFLDEIGDLALPSQAALLRVLQEREVIPVGATQPIPVDLRVVAATHVPIDQHVKRGTFRSDLLGRLAGFTFSVPPLRDRREDIGLVLANLLAQIPLADPLLTAKAARALLGHSWPRNIRELSQCLSSAAVLAEGGVIQAFDLPQAMTRPRAADARPDAASSPWPLPAGVRAPDDERLRDELIAKFAQHAGNVSHVARAMGKARSQIQRWMRRFEIDPEKYRSS